MNPVQIGDCTLYQGDCLEILPTLPKVDAVVTDPPYGIDFTQRTTGAKIIGDDKPFDPAHLLEIGKEHLIWGGNHFVNHLPPGTLHVWLKRAVEIAAPKTYSDCEFAWCSNGGASKVFRLISDGCIRQGREHGVRRVHPSQKPIEIMEWSLGFVCDGVTLDPYMGSGTTGMACVAAGRPFVGVEVDPEYFELSCERIQKAYDQPDLFVAPPSKPVQEDMKI